MFLQQKGEKLEHFSELSQTKIFGSTSEFDCQAMMFCFKTRFKNFNKNQQIVRQGEEIQDILLIVKGSAKVENVDVLGDISIVSQLKRGDMYGLESAYAGDEHYKDSVVATEKCLVLFMNKHRAINPCENRCRRHENFTKALTEVVANRNLQLLEKLTHMSKKTIREKLLSYFSSLAVKKDSAYFEIPFNKTELAHYLSVDRSAMSTELSKMRDEGLIDFDKRQFRLAKNLINIED